MIQCRLRWDLMYSPWTDIDDRLMEGLASGRSTTLRLEPPTDWRFNANMIQQLGGQIALETTLISVEFRKV